MALTLPPVALTPPRVRACCSAKSTVAAEAALAINPALRVRALQNRVSPDTEHVFDDAFWGSLDMVVRALSLKWPLIPAGPWHSTVQGITMGVLMPVAPHPGRAMAQCSARGHRGCADAWGVLGRLWHTKCLYFGFLFGKAYTEQDGNTA